MLFEFWSSSAQTHQPSNSCPAEMRRWAGEAIGLIEAAASERAGRLPASVRTVRLCGTAGLVAFSLIGETHQAVCCSERLTVLLLSR